MKDAVTVALLAIGTLFSVASAIGMLRFPDMFTRMHAATKSGTLGVGCIILAVAVDYGNVATTTRALLVVVFFFLTAPIAAHVIARAAHHMRVGLWEGTQMNEYPSE